MIFEKLNSIRAFVLDVDGVLTNNHLLITEAGNLLRTMNVRDGQAVKIAVEAGYHVAAITKGASIGVKKRLIGLGFEEVIDGLNEKTLAFGHYTEKYKIAPESVLYMGDDLPDLEIFSKVGISACPNDAVPEVLNSADYISPIKGGGGCVRDVIEKVMRVQGSWPVYIF